jgi:hypothetical protein
MFICGNMAFILRVNCSILGFYVGVVGHIPTSTAGYVRHDGAKYSMSVEALTLSLDHTKRYRIC